MSNELKPCPFCGSKYISVIVPVETEYQVQCGNCYASSSIESTEKKAIKAWNSRTTSDHIVAANKTADDNPPLTLEELRGMGGEPVWIEPVQQWRIVHIDCDGEFVGLHTEFDIISAKGVLNNDGRIYRRKPEEDTKWQL